MDPTAITTIAFSQLEKNAITHKLFIRFCETTFYVQVTNPHLFKRVVKSHAKKGQKFLKPCNLSGFLALGSPSYMVPTQELGAYMCDIPLSTLLVHAREMVIAENEFYDCL